MTMARFNEIGVRQRIALIRHCHQAHVGLLLIILLVLLTSCQLTQSSFSRTVNNASAIFSAASLTLNYVHQGKINSSYAHSLFQSYQNKLHNLDKQLLSQPSPLNHRLVLKLVMFSHSALMVINQPCFDTSCDWRSQLYVLQQANQAFLHTGAS